MGIEPHVLRKHARRVYGSRWHGALASDARCPQSDIEAMNEGEKPVPNFVVEALVDAIAMQRDRLGTSLAALEPYRRSGRA